MPALRREFHGRTGILARLWEALGESARPAWAADLETRAVRHTLACLLARVVGRSPLEYLDAAERSRQRECRTAHYASPAGHESRISFLYSKNNYADHRATNCSRNSGQPGPSHRQCATCMLAGGAVASASVPSGASTGTAEALELRDRDPQRYGGLGCRKAVAQVSGEIHGALAGRGFADQAELDRALIELDGTPNKSRLGANAILAVSVAFARACALQRGVTAVPVFRRHSGALARYFAAPHH